MDACNRRLVLRGIVRRLIDPGCGAIPIPIDVDVQCHPVTVVFDAVDVELGGEFYLREVPALHVALEGEDEA